MQKDYSINFDLNCYTKQGRDDWAEAPNGSVRVYYEGLFWRYSIKYFSGEKGDHAICFRDRELPGHCDQGFHRSHHPIQAIEALTIADKKAIEDYITEEARLAEEYCTIAIDCISDGNLNEKNPLIRYKSKELCILYQVEREYLISAKTGQRNALIALLTQYRNNVVHHCSLITEITNHLIILKRVILLLQDLAKEDALVVDVFKPYRLTFLSDQEYRYKDNLANPVKFAHPELLKAVDDVRAMDQSVQNEVERLVETYRNDYVAEFGEPGAELIQDVKEISASSTILGKTF